MKSEALPGLVRPFTLLAPAVGAAAGAIVAEGATHLPLPLERVLLAVSSALLVTAASNAWNQAFDAGLDRINKPHRPIPAGLATEREALVLGHVCAVGGLVLGLVVGVWFFACVCLGVVGTWIYSAPPLRTKRLPFGALLTIAIPRGALVPVAGWAVVTTPSASDPWALGAIAGLFVLGAAGTKDFADVQGDRAHGCRTLPIVFGARRAARMMAPFLVLPFGLLPLAGWLGWLQPSVASLAVLGGVLALVGGVTAWVLVRDPEGLGERGRNHPAWALMYLLLLGTHIGTAILYANL